jgi:hypothetical protein
LDRSPIGTKTSDLLTDVHLCSIKRPETASHVQKKPHPTINHAQSCLQQHLLQFLPTVPKIPPPLTRLSFFPTAANCYPRRAGPPIAAGPALPDAPARPCPPRPCTMPLHRGIRLRRQPDFRCPVVRVGGSVARPTKMRFSSPWICIDRGVSFQ